MYPNIWTWDVSACLPTLLMFHLLTFQKCFLVHHLKEIKSWFMVSNVNGGIFNFFTIIFEILVRDSLYVSTADSKHIIFRGNCLHIDPYSVSMDTGPVCRVDTYSSTFFFFFLNWHQTKKVTGCPSWWWICINWSCSPWYSSGILWQSKNYEAYICMFNYK